MFFAYIVTAKTNLPVSSTVVYEVDRYNPSLNYNATTGLFTCPITGTYQFHVTVQANHVDYQLEIVKETVVVGYLSPGTVGSNYSQTGSVTIVTHCNAGESVHVRVGYAPGGYAYLEGARRSHFAGFLVAADI